MEAIAARLGVAPRVVHGVIAVLRSSGAPGVCSSGIAERLGLQVSALAGTTVVPRAVEALVGHGLDRLVDGSVEAVGAACGLRPHEVREALTWIRAHVEADLFAADGAAPPVVVDIVVRREGGGFVLDVVPGPWSGLRVAESCTVAAADPAVAREIARATRFIDGLSRRAAALVQVAEVVVTRSPGACSKDHAPTCRCAAGTWLPNSGFTSRR